MLRNHKSLLPGKTGPWLLLSAALLIFASTRGSAQSVVNHEDYYEPFSGVLLASETPGLPEDVVITGEFHVESTTVGDANGGVHTHLIYQSSGGFTAVGLTSGLDYQVIGTSQVHFSAAFPVRGNTLLQQELTTVIPFQLVAPGARNNYWLEISVLSKVAMTGETSVEVQRFKAEVR